MTYQEMQERLTKVETLIQAVQQPRYQNKVQNVQETLTQLNTIKENLENKMKILAEAEGTITTDDEAQAEKLAKKGHNVNLKEDIDGGEFFDTLKSMKYKVKSHHHSENSFIVSNYDQYVIFDFDKDTQKFHIRSCGGFRIDDDKALAVGMRSKSDTGKAGVDTFSTDRNFNPVSISGDKLLDFINYVMEGTGREREAVSDFYRNRLDVDESINEGEGDDHHYVKIPRLEFRDANRIVKDYVNTFNKDNKVYDNDEKALDFGINGPATGDDVYTFYFDFDDKYIANGAAEAFIADLTGELSANGVMVIESSVELDENINEEKIKPGTYAGVAVVVHMNGPQTEWKVEFIGDSKFGPAGTIVDYVDVIANLKFDDDTKPTDYMKRRDASSDHPQLKEEKIEVDGNTEFTLKLNHLLDKHVKEIIDEMSEDEMDGGATQGQLDDEDDHAVPYHDEGDQIREDLDLGHQDDEPHMLKKEVYDIAVYAAKLYKQLKKYDAMENEVDFPHWWQRKITLAREYMSKAQHYLEFEEKEPMIDQLALEGKMKNEIGMFNDPIGYKKSEPETPVFTHKYVGKGAYHILKNGKKFMTLFGSEGEANAYVNKRNKELKGEGKYKSDAQRKAIYATKAEKGELKERTHTAIKKSLDIEFRKRKERVKDYVKAQGEEKQKIKDELKQMTAKINALEKEYNNAVPGINRNQELSDMDEARPSGFGTGQGRSKTIKKGRESNQDIKDRLDQPEEELPTYKVINGVVNKLRDGRYVPLKRKVNETKISKKKFKELLAEAYYEVLAEAEAPESVETFTRRYPDLEKALIKLHTDDYSDFVKEVRLITPKPTELAVVIKNNQEYTLKWLGKDWEISVRGERHYLGNATEVQEALKDIAILAKEAPMGEPEEEQEDTGGDAGFDDLGGGGGADTGGLDDLGGEDETGEADLSDEPIDFEDEA